MLGYENTYLANPSNANIVKEIKYINCFIDETNHTNIEIFFDKKIKSIYFFGEDKSTFREIGRFTLVKVKMQQKIPGVLIATANVDYATGNLQHFDIKINRQRRYFNNKPEDFIFDFTINLSPDFRPIQQDVFEK